MALPVDLIKTKPNGCPKCAGKMKKSENEFINIVKEKSPNIEVLGKYINNRTSILCRCKICNYTWYANPRYLQKEKKRSSGCPKCSNVLKISHEEFVDRVKQINPKIKIIGKYESANKKVLCSCEICNYQWGISPSKLYVGQGCPKCGGKLKISHEEFIQIMNNINPNIEIIGNYKNISTKILCKCKKCNYIWEAIPLHLKNTKHPSGCPNCAGNLTKTHEQFISEMSKRHPDIKVLEKYVNWNTKILCQCKTCSHKWMMSPGKLLRKDSLSGCPSCNQSNGERFIQLFLESNNIKYEKYQKYDDLIGVGEGKLSYDFYLPSYNLLIEFQGIQHEHPIEHFGGEEQFKIQQEHDKRKREYAQKNNIVLLEIWYYDFDNIEQILESRLLKQSA